MIKITEKKRVSPKRPTRPRKPSKGKESIFQSYSMSSEINRLLLDEIGTSPLPKVVPTRHLMSLINSGKVELSVALDSYKRLQLKLTVIDADFNIKELEYTEKYKDYKEKYDKYRKDVIEYAQFEKIEEQRKNEEKFRELQENLIRLQDDPKFAEKLKKITSIVGKLPKSKVRKIKDPFAY